MLGLNVQLALIWNLTINFLQIWPQKGKFILCTCVHCTLPTHPPPDRLLKICENSKDVVCKVVRGVWKVPEKYQEGVWKLYGRGLKGV